MGQPDSGVVRCAVDGPIARITIARSEARNALNAAVFGALEQAFDEIEASSTVRAVIVLGDGNRAFCAGADLDELRSLSGTNARALLGRGQRLMRRIEALEVPTIAAVRGWALGGGFELALACTLIVASESARFGLPEAGLGLMPGYGGTQRLTRAIGANAALSCMLTDDRLAADRAWELGLLARPPVDDDSLEPLAIELASQIVTRAPVAVALILEAVDSALPAGTDLRHETALASLATSSGDAAEGISAFLEKRQPSFGQRPL